MASTKQTSRSGSRLCLVLIALAATGCSGDSSPQTDPDNTPAGLLRADVLASLGENVIVPAQTEFATRAASLTDALDAAVSGSGTREAAQAAWRSAADAWQRVELMQVGPAGSSVDVMGGQDLRSRIYTWPSLNLCAIDRVTAGEDYDSADGIDAIPAVPRGLGVIEYLLFNDDPSNNCNDLDAINSDNIWDGLGDDVPSRRLAQAAATSTLVQRGADALVDAWNPDSGNFLQELTSPSRSGALFGSAQEGLNAVSNAMFYLDKETKDMKLAEPIGITGCDAQRCPDAIESRWALASKEHLVANLEAFRLLYLGGTTAGALGYDDLLEEMGGTDVADDLTAAIDEAIAATNAIPGTLTEAIDANPQAVEDAHEAVRVVTDILKSEFLSLLELELPRRAEGDND